MNMPPATAAMAARRGAEQERELVAAVQRRDRGWRRAASSASVRAAAKLASTASPSAPPIMNAVLTTPEARPDSLGRHVAHRAEQQRIERDAGADAEQRHARQHVDDELAVERRAREQREPGRGEQQARLRAERECRSA